MSISINTMRSTDMNKSTIGVMPVEQKKRKMTNQIDGQFTLYNTGAPNTIICEFFSGEFKKVRRGRHIPDGQMLFYDIGVEWTNVVQFPEAKTGEKVGSSSETATVYAVNELFDNNLGLIGYSAKSVAGVNSSNWADIEQAGYIALWKAAENFDASRGVKFASYATIAIKRAMYRELSQYKDKLNPESLDALEEENSVSLKAELVTTEDEVLGNQNNAIIDAMLQVADSLRLVKEQKGVRAYAMQLQGYSTQRILDSIGVAKKSYSAIISVGRRALQSHPIFMRMAADLRNESAKVTTVNLLDSQFELKYAKDFFFDVPSKYEANYEASFAEFVSQEHIAEYLMFEARIGEPVCIINKETGCASVVNVGNDSLELTYAMQSGRKIKSKRVA